MTDSQRAMITLRWAWAAAMWGLLIVTCRLWLPDTAGLQAVIGQGANSGPAFPSLPFFRFPQPLAMLVEIVAGVGWLVALGSVLASKRLANSMVPYGVLVVSLSLLFVANQHRLQPWAYQGWLYAWLFASCCRSRSRLSDSEAAEVAAGRQQRWLIVLTASVYGYSALGKFDYQFLHTVGPELLTGLLRGVLGESLATTLSGQRWLVGLLPATELLIAIGLLVPLTRRWAGWGAVGMHLVLLAALGPWALDHSGGVLIWNLFLAFQAWYCFARQQPVSCSFAGTEALMEGGRRRPLLRWMVNGLLTAAVLLPLLERQPRQAVATYWDHWLSWSLYSPHTSRAEIQIHRSAVPLLPSDWQLYVLGSDDDDWCAIQLGRWSLQQLSVPVYPQARFQLGLALDISNRLQAAKRGSAIRVKLLGPSDRWTGHRAEQWALGSEEISRLAEPFWFCQP